MIRYCLKLFREQDGKTYYMHIFFYIYNNNLKRRKTRKRRRADSITFFNSLERFRLKISIYPFSWRSNLRTLYFKFRVDLY